MLRIERSFVEGLEDLPFFYPHSGRDWLPVNQFAPLMREFHFVDREYFRDEMEKQTPVFGLSNSRFRLREMSFSPAPARSHDEHASGIMRNPEPLIRTEVYEARRERFRVVLRCEHSVAAFESLEQIGCFFYRGDSSEGGNVAWLSADQELTHNRQPAMLLLVLEKLVNGGLLITDGSRVEEKGSAVAALKQFSGQNILPGASDVVPFEAHGRRFECLGSIARSEFRGPTLVWRVMKNA
jgi:hypothetical protein